MYYQGRNKRRVFRKRLKNALISLSAITVLTLCYYLFIKPDSAVQKVDPVQNTALAHKILSDSMGGATGGQSSVGSMPLANNSHAGALANLQSPADEKSVALQSPETVSAPVSTPVATLAIAKVKSKGPFYEVSSVAYVYKRPSEYARTKKVIHYWNYSYSSIKPIFEKKGFVFVELGKSGKGWLRKKDLKKVDGAYEDNKG